MYFYFKDYNLETVDFETLMLKLPGYFQMKIMFMKIDTNCDGTVDWDEFCTYMLLEYKERQDMNYVNETPFPQVGTIQNSWLLFKEDV